MPTVTVNLDDDPKHRWDAIVKPRAAGIKALIDGFIIGFSKEDPDSPRVKRIEQLLSLAALPEMKRMPADYAAEMKGIAKATGLPVGTIWCARPFTTASNNHPAPH